MHFLKPPDPEPYWESGSRRSLNLNPIRSWSETLPVLFFIYFIWNYILILCQQILQSYKTFFQFSIIEIFFININFVSKHLRVRNYAKRVPIPVTYLFKI